MLLEGQIKDVGGLLLSGGNCSHRVQTVSWPCLPVVEFLSLWAGTRKWGNRSWLKCCRLHLFLLQFNRFSWINVSTSVAWLISGQLKSLFYNCIQLLLGNVFMELLLPPFWKSGSWAPFTMHLSLCHHHLLMHWSFLVDYVISVFRTLSYSLLCFQHPAWYQVQRTCWMWNESKYANLCSFSEVWKCIRGGYSVDWHKRNLFNLLKCDVEYSFGLKVLLSLLYGLCSSHVKVLKYIWTVQVTVRLCVNLEKLEKWE